PRGDRPNSQEPPPGAQGDPPGRPPRHRLLPQLRLLESPPRPPPPRPHARHRAASPPLVRHPQHPSDEPPGLPRLDASAPHQDRRSPPLRRRQNPSHAGRRQPLRRTVPDRGGTLKQIGRKDPLTTIFSLASSAAAVDVPLAWAIPF